MSPAMSRLALVALSLVCGVAASSAAPSSRSSNCAGATDWYCNHWCGGDLEFLDDSKCVKAFPSTYDRDWTSPLRVSAIPPASEGWSQDTGSFADFSINNTALTSLAGDANVCAILIRRVSGDPAPYFRFLCAEGDDVNAYETWSSSKIYAMANAAGHIRDECPNSGMTSTTTGEHGVTPLGDLATVIASYDTTAGYTSNGLSCYMHDLGWRERIQNTLVGWHPTPNNLSLGGNYGVPTPPDLGFALDNATCWTPRDPGAPRWNSLSMLAHADLLRRLVMHGQLPAASQWPGMTLDDAKTIWYGANTSLLFPGLTWGGMSTDTQIFVQSAVDMDKVVADGQGSWRLFSKLGAGWSSSRLRGEILSATYAAWPVLDSAGTPVVDAGVEFIVVARGSVPQDTTLVQAQADVHMAIGKVVGAIYNHEL